jgi:hypothetical protein
LGRYGGLGISVFSNWSLSNPAAVSMSSMASYKSMYLFKKMKAASILPAFLLASPASK